MSRHRFPIDDFIAQIADEKDVDPETIVVDNMEVSVKRGELVVDVHATNPAEPTHGNIGERR